MGRQKVGFVLLLGFGSIFYLSYSSNFSRPAVVPIFPPAGLEQSTVCGGVRGPTTSRTIFFITPTYPRREQVAELTRLGQTLLLAEDLHWIVAEDAEVCSPLVSAILNRFNIPYTHISSPQPSIFKQAKLKSNPRGVSSRRAGLHWVMNNYREGVVYFADDDNTYDMRLFRELSTTKKISMFPVGFIGEQGVSSPIVEDGEVVGFSDAWFARRKFPVDMAGFAVNVGFLRERNPRADIAMPYKVGYEEDVFLRSLKFNLSEIEPLAENCTQVLVWHTQTMREKKSALYLEEREEGTSLSYLLKFIQFSGIADEAKSGTAMKACYKGQQCKTGS